MSDANIHIKVARAEIAHTAKPTLITDTMQGLLDEIERLRKIEEEANLLLVWTHQDAIDRDIEDGEKWHVNDLHPSVWNGLNSAERDLYHALKQPSVDGIQKGEKE